MDRRIISIVGCSLGVLTLSALVAVAQTDYSKLPDPKPRHAELSERKTRLADAVLAAEKATGGIAARAEAVERDGKAVYELEVYTADSARRVTVDAESGAVIENRSSLLPGDPITGDLTTTASGLQFAIIREGTGEKPEGPTATVKVHYSGWLVDGSKFDSSVDRGQPASFPLNGVIKGWTEGVGDMKVGEKRKLVIPFALAYGEQGRPPRIPPKALLVFDVELLEIVK
jgi:FKBP-type peptidyl-prolyl cis-trans isomerase